MEPKGKIYDDKFLFKFPERYGFKRKAGEKSLAFRKRIFPKFFKKSPIKALEILFGYPVENWDEKSDENFALSFFYQIMEEKEFEKILSSVVKGDKRVWGKLNKYPVKKVPDADLKIFAKEMIRDFREIRKKRK